MGYILVKNGNVILENRIIKADLLVKDGVIADTDFMGEIPENCEIIDAKDCYVSPGFIDIHLHGGAGYDFMDCTVEAFKEISDIHLKNGTTTMIPTAVSSEFDNTLKFMEIYKKSKPLCPNFHGIHLEGPYISVEQKGAHKAHLLHSPTEYETEMLLAEGKGILKSITAAPEVEGVLPFAKIMTEHGVVMSLGHSNATSSQAKVGFQNGFSHVTHLYCATPSIRKINQVMQGGVVEAAYLDDDVSIELIGDGKHVALDAMRLALKIKGSDKVALVSDALRPAGTNVTESYLGEKTPENRVIIEDGVAKLPDRSSFAGSIATGINLLERGINHYGLSFCDTVKMLTRTPATILGINDRGILSEGYNADIVIFDSMYNIKNVILGGTNIVGEI